VDVSLGLASYTVTLSALEEDEAVLGGVDYILTEALNEYPCELIFSDNQRLRLLSVLEEVIELFVVDLQE